MRPHGMALAIAAMPLVALVLGSCAHGAEATWTLVNPTGRSYENEPVRLKVDVPSSARRDGYAVTADGAGVPWQLEEVDGEARAWVLATVGGNGRVAYRFAPGRPTNAEPAVRVERDGDHYVLDNEKIAVRVPASGRREAPGPISGVRLPGGTWVGRSFWRSDREFEGLTAEVVGDGTIFGKVRLTYRFAGTAGLLEPVDAFATVEVALFPGQSHVVVEESHEMGRGAYWEFDCAHGWSARDAICIPHSGGFGRPAFGAWPPNTLATGQTRMGDRLLNLMPRWSQAYDEGWMFVAHDGTNAVGAMVCRAGKWFWPHENLIEVRVKDSADYAGLRCPTMRGRRYWFLVAGPVATWQGKGAKSYVTRHAFQPLDKLVNDYILAWPGLEGILSSGNGKKRRKKPKLGGFSGVDFFSGGINPTGAWRGYGKRVVRDAGRQGNLSTLTKAQVIFDPDCYGTYWDFWSPENPNFFTDFIKPGIVETTRLTGHPRFAELARAAELKFREDLYHSVTLPGGAGQECPGYLAHAMKQWKTLRPLCARYLGFDPATWPRYRAGASFLLHVSQPIGAGSRRCHPGGDTHPLGPDVERVASEFGVEEDVTRFVTEELPGFGVVFRNRPGTDDETYFAFKAGPNRGHFHGDQLSFHYCARAKQVAIDHMCSYSPRAGQEHMHNRVALHTDELPFANMDGFERLVAFDAGAEVDVAMAQVESDRLRVTEERPPEKWDWYLPEQRFETPLVYRRTVVFVKGRPGDDYFVVRDQYAGPSVSASYCLHVLSDSVRRDGRRFEFGDLTLYCARPAAFAFEPLDWSHERKDRKTGKTYIRESTRGVRLTVAGPKAEFVTVLYPGRGPAMSAIPGGVRVGNDEIVFAGGIEADAATSYARVTRDGREVARLTGSDIDMDRSQGEVGLFVPDAGYPFGDVPDWLARQRARRPAWYQEVIENAKSRRR